MHFIFVITENQLPSNLIAELCYQRRQWRSRHNSSAVKGLNRGSLHQGSIVYTLSENALPMLKFSNDRPMELAYIQYNFDLTKNL